MKLKVLLSPAMMKVINTISEMRQWRKAHESESVGFVPTMGFLHEGHLSLIRVAKKKSQFVVLSIYVNPTQFAPDEDLEQYPRDFARDEQLCIREGVDVLFCPSNKAMYHPNHKTYVFTEGLSQQLCGKSRPAHFQGVTTIVAKLFNIIRPTLAVFGQKDAQQALIIRRMVQDLNFDMKIEVAPIIREKDGLALSSRNKYLSEQQRQEAPVLQQSLKYAKKEFETGNSDFKSIKEQMIKQISEHSSAKLDYIEFTDAETLSEVHPETKKILVALAVYFGQTRLIDNIILE